MKHVTGPKLRVLVADDNAPFRELVSEFLLGEGHEVDQAIDGPDAWARLTAQQYDYVILDLHMPNLNGLDVLRLVRKLTSRPRAILVTGAKSTHVERMALALGAAGCYPKPLSLDRLLVDLTWAPRFSDRPSDHTVPCPSSGE